jgi:hypothetical protein
MCTSLSRESSGCEASGVIKKQQAANGGISDPGLILLDPADMRQVHAAIRSLPRPELEGFTKAFRKRFQVPAEASSIADRIYQRRHHDWIEAFLVSHTPVGLRRQSADAAKRLRLSTITPWPSPASATIPP